MGDRFAAHPARPAHQDRPDAFGISGPSMGSSWRLPESPADNHIVNPVEPGIAPALHVAVRTMRRLKSRDKAPNPVPWGEAGHQTEQWSGGRAGALAAM